MYAKVWNYLRGTVQFQCESPAPERVLNLCAAHEIPFWDVRWETAERFTLRTTREGAAQLEMVAAECGAAAAWGVMDDMMEALRICQPRAYQGVMRKLLEAKE